MAEVKEREDLSQGTETEAVQAAESAPAKVPLKEKWKSMPRKTEDRASGDPPAGAGRHRGNFVQGPRR